MYTCNTVCVCMCVCVCACVCDRVDFVLAQELPANTSAAEEENCLVQHFAQLVGLRRLAAHPALHCQPLQDAIIRIVYARIDT